MGLFRVQYGDGPTEEIPALNAEEAWDTYKVRTGRRRDILAEQRGEIKPPTVEEIPDAPEAGKRLQSSRKRK